MKLAAFELQNVPTHFRPAPFWSWNDDLQPSELRRQINLMHEAGLGGFFMHARSGLVTEYMGDVWMECISACLDEASKLGMEAWLYDENGWPSGFGSGIVNGLGIRYQQKILNIREIAAADAGKNETAIAFYSADCRKYFGKSVPADYREKNVCEIYFDVNPYYVDLLDAEVVKKFLEITHQRYFSSFSEKEQKSLRGIFTDEPQLTRWPLIQWSFVLPEEYEKAYGRDLLPELPGLFRNDPDSEAFRVRFWSLVSRLFSDAYLKQICEWCDAHGWELTGHMVLEENYCQQLTTNGSLMPQYQYFHVPGIDRLCRREADMMILKQAASVAAQCGKEQILTESFALSGWDLNFRGMRWLYQIQLVNGINYLCQHLHAYSLRGMRKRDYPLSSSHHMAWWSEYKRMNDYFSRVGMLLASGVIESDILVMHGISSAWCCFPDRVGIDRLSRALENLSWELSCRQARWHYADETMIESMGSIEDGKFKIGRQSYKVLVLPELTNLSRCAFELMKKFKAVGGRIVAVGRKSAVKTIDGEKISAEEESFLQSCYWAGDCAETAEAALDGIKCVQVTENNKPVRQILSTSRKFDDLGGRHGEFFYFINRYAEKECRVRITLPVRGKVEIIDELDGKFYSVKDVCEKSDSVSFDWDFAPCGAAMFFVSETGEASSDENFPMLYSRLLPLVKIPQEKWSIVGDFRNMITLDCCEFRVDGGAWEYNDVNVIHERLLRLGRECRLDMRFTFRCRGGIDGMMLAVETPEKFKFTFNGEPFEFRDCGMFVDPACRCAVLPRTRDGENQLLLEHIYFQRPEVYARMERAKVYETEFNMRFFDSEIEAIYLLGDFSVNCALDKWCCEPETYGDDGKAICYPQMRYCGGDFELGALETTVDAGDFVRSGLPFYSDRLTISRKIELAADEAEKITRFGFRCQGVNGAKVSINGKYIGEAWWEPYSLNIPEGVLHQGENEITIETVFSLRNLYGPLHIEGRDCEVVSPITSLREPNVLGWSGANYDSSYAFIRHGIFDMIFA